MNQQDRMIAKQAEIISRLNAQVSNLLSEKERLQVEVSKLKPAHDYYMMLQKAAQESEAVAGQFERLILLCKMSLEDDVKGLTS